MNKLVLLVTSVVLCVLAVGTRGGDYSESDPGLYYPNYPFPCSIKISVKYTNVNKTSGETLVDRTDFIYLHDHYVTYGSFGTSKEGGHTKIIATQSLYRGDMKKNVGDREIAFEGIVCKQEKGMIECEGDEMWESDQAKFYANWIPYIILGGRFSKVEEGQFQGKNCTVYSNYYKNSDEVYVDSDNWVIGIKLGNTPDGCEYIGVLSYEFYAPLDVFVINKEKFPTANETFFKPPTEATCPAPSSSSSAASTITIAFGVIVLCVASIVASFF